MRQSDYGLDLLGTIVDTQLKAADFLIFKVVDALEVINADIMEEIRRANRGCFAANFVFYFSKNFPHNFTQGALLIAECFADYYRTGELVVYMITSVKTTIRLNTTSRNCSHGDYLQLLLEELQSVQDPEHWLYQFWIQGETRRE